MVYKIFKARLKKQLRALIWETRGSRTWCRWSYDPSPGMQSVPLRQLVLTCAKLNLHPPKSRLLPSHRALGFLVDWDRNNVQEQVLVHMLRTAQQMVKNQRSKCWNLWMYFFFHHEWTLGMGDRCAAIRPTSPQKRKKKRLNTSSRATQTPT